jgi:hypothetical protein
LKIIKSSIEEMEDLFNKNESINENNEVINTGQSNRPISKISLDLIKKKDITKSRFRREGVILKLQ